MRKQYHIRKVGDDTHIWDVHRLVALSENFAVKQVPLSSIKELDEAFWYDNDSAEPTCRNIAKHAKLISETDLKYPIILSANGRVMDGMHRVCKALLEEKETISAVQFDEDPTPDYMNVSLDDLPYDE